MIKTARYIFDGWTGKYRDKYKGNFSFFEADIRKQPECPDVLGYVTTIWPEEMEDEGEETKAGTILLANYYYENVKPEDIEVFLKEFGIKFHRASPFIVEPKNTTSFPIHPFLANFLEKIFKAKN